MTSLPALSATWSSTTGIFKQSSEWDHTNPDNIFYLCLKTFGLGVEAGTNENLSALHLQRRLLTSEMGTDLKTRQFKSLC